MKWYILAILLSFPAFAQLFHPGYFPMHDDISVLRVHQMELCFRDGQIPCRWVSDMGYRYGYPQFEYYGPLPYYVMTLSRFSGVSLFGAVKLGFILPLIFGAASMFLLSSFLFGKTGGLLSAIAYTYLPFRASDIYSRGAMGESWAFIFLPLILYALLKLYEKPDMKSSSLLGLSYAGLLTTHNVTTLLFSPLLGLFAIVILFGRQNKLSIIRHGLISVVWAILIAGFFFLPLLFEQGFAHTESLISGYFNYLAHFVSIKQLFLSTFWGYGSSEIGPTDDLSFFAGPVHLFLVIISLILVCRSYLARKSNQQTKIVILCVVLATVSFFMTHEKSSFIWKNLPILAYLQFPWRFLVTANFFMALATGFSVSNLDKQTAKCVLPVFGFLIIFFNLSYFRPRLWLDLSIEEKFSGVSWDRQLTTSIFDYLPIYSKLPPVTPAPLLPYSAEGKVSILDYSHRSNEISFKTRNETDLFLIVPQFDFPGWQVSLNGQTVIHNHDNELGLISFVLPVGGNQVSVVFTNTPIRLIGNLSTLIFGVTAFYFLTRSQKHV